MCGKQTLEKEKGMTRLKRLTTIGATRWWPKNRVLRAVFGNYRWQCGTVILHPELQRRGKKGDETPITPLEYYQATCYNVIMDAAMSSITSRFSQHKDLYLDISCFDPRNFASTSESVTSVPICLEKVTNILCQQDIAPFSSTEPVMEQQQKLKELLDFAGRWESLKKTLPQEYDTGVAEVEDPDEVPEESHDLDQNEETPTSECNSCRNCIRCVFNNLKKYNLYTETYSHLFPACKLLLTLSVTQIACETNFFKLKFIKSKPRNSLTEEHLRSFMLMSCEKDILASVEAQEIIDKLAQKSKEMQWLLLV